MIDPQNSNPPLLGRYQVLSELAKSPIGGLTLALDVPEHRVVALRSFPVENRISSLDNLLLLEAGKWVKGLSDSAIMQPLEVGTQEGVLHAAYDYHVSEPLRGVLRMASFKGNPMPVAVALRIAHDIVLGARAIEAWGASPALGDTLCGGLLPDSILVGQDGKTRICDAGIAAVLRRTPEYGQLAEVLGYAAPEQLDGTGAADSRSDVFTLGVLLWEMLANRRLFTAPQLGDLMDKVRSMPVPSLDSLQRSASDAMPQAVAGLVARALEREPKDRYAGTTALLQALETHAGNLMASAAQVGSYISSLVGNVLETRSRVLDHALAPAAEPEQRSNPAVVLRSVGKSEKGQDPRPRAATTTPQKSSPKATAPIPPPPPKNRTTPTPKQRGSRPSVHIAPVTPLPVAPRTAMKSSPPIIAALVDDAIAQGAREAKTASGHVHPTLPPASTPLEAVLPGLPKTFDLPGAELFATPGLPLVTRKSTAPATQRDAAVPNVTGDAAHAVDPAPALDSTQSAAASAELPELGGLAELEPDPTQSRASHLRRVLHAWHASRERLQRVRKRTWLGLSSLLFVALLTGLIIRSCTRGADMAPAVASVGIGSSAAAVATVPASAPVPMLASTTAPVVEPLVDASVEDKADAGVVRKPAVRSQQAPQRARKRSTAAPRYNSKVTRSRGKTTR